MIRFSEKGGKETEIPVHHKPLCVGRSDSLKQPISEIVTARPPAMFLSEPNASERFWEFVTANIRNKNTSARLLLRRRPDSQNDVKETGCTILRA
jgi:hypothetical protein